MTASSFFNITRTGYCQYYNQVLFLIRLQLPLNIECFYCFLNNKSSTIMKRSMLTLSLLAFVIMLTTSFAVTPDFKTKPVAVQIGYYWFDANNEYLFRQNTLDDEIALTGLNESTQNPKTLQEKGWAVGNVNFDQWGTPVGIGTPDKALYSHP
jgi:hypothetical protein